MISSKGVLFVLAVTTGFWGCSKDDKDEDDDAGTGDQEAATFTVVGALNLDTATALADTAGSPTSLKVLAKTIWLSANEDCTDPVQVGTEKANPQPSDFAAAPEIFEGSPPDGTYKCVILKMSDNMTLKPDATAAAAFPGQCETTKEYTFDIYRETIGGYVDINGEVIPSRGTRAAPVSDDMYLFISTGIEVDEEQTALNPEIVRIKKADGTYTHPAANQAVHLDGVLDVPGKTFFVTDATNFLSGVDEDDSCTLEGLLFSFVKAD